MYPLFEAVDVYVETVDIKKTNVVQN